MNRNSENMLGKSRCRLFGREVTKEEFDNYRKTQHFPIRMEKYFPEWAKNQSPTLSQEELEGRWWQLKDRVHALMVPFLPSYRVAIVQHDDFEGYLVDKAASLDRVEATFNQEVRQPVMDFKKSHPEVVHVNIALDKDGQPNVFDVAANFKPHKSYAKEADELTVPVEELAGSDAEIVDQLIDYIKEKVTEQGFELVIKPEVRDYYIDLAGQADSIADLRERFKLQISQLVAECHDDRPGEESILVEVGGTSVNVGPTNSYDRYTAFFADNK
ncbi:hypothetical protein OZX65_06005 [Leuconostocaceae bacterium ESL0723]|nr:hypothetical protein OZX65_06005 [Leuconostocaceae bacterium ESL0723]